MQADIINGAGTIREGPNGVDLSGFPQVTVVLPDSENARIADLLHWLTRSFSLDLEMCSVVVQELWSWFPTDIRWELKTLSTEIMQRAERPDDIQDIIDDPPNPDQPISESRMAPKPKPWEKQGQEISSLDLKSQSSNSSESRSEVQNDNSNQATGSSSNSNKGDLLLLAGTVAGSEAPADGAASSK